MRFVSALAVCLVATAPLAVPLSAQTSKRPLTQADWDRWRSISGARLSDDGRWAAYSLVPQVGDGELVVRSTSGSTEYRLPRGFIGRPEMRPGAPRDSSLAVAPAVFSADSRYLLALTYAPKAEYDRTRKLPAARQPKASLAIMRLSDGQVATVPRVRSFHLPRYAGRYAAYLLEDSVAASPARDSAARAPQRARRQQFGSTLVLRELATGRETRIPDVSSFVMDDSAKVLAYLVASHTPERDGAYVRSLAGAEPGPEVALLSGVGEYRQLAVDRAGRQAAFLATSDTGRLAPTRLALYEATLATPLRPDARAVAVARPGVFGDSVIISENGRVTFTRDGSAILFGVAPPPLDSIPADSLWDKAIFDLWSWNDPRLQSQQRVEAPRDRRRAFTAVYQPATKRAVRLADDSLPQVTVSNDGRVALAATRVPYAIESMWGEGGTDLWAIDTRTGARTLIRKKIQGQAQLSPNGKYVAFFDDGRWFAYNTVSGKTADLTGRLAGVRFADERSDVPDVPDAYGIAGWTTGDNALLVYDRYDIWEMDPSGARAPRVLTDSVGRRGHLELRVVDLDRDDPSLDPSEPLLLRAFDDQTKASGFYRDRIGVTRAPERLVMADVDYGTPQKARDAEEYLVTRGTFVEFPDLYAGHALTDLARISDANPQQKEVRWGSVELVSWFSSDGVKLQGLLYKPEGFDPSKKYPMITYFYERLSDNLHRYVPPGGRNVINPTHYISNGYLIFEPDIVYETGYPGPSAMKSIIPGIQMLLARGYVDSAALGVQGQSWGGYQTLYLVTQSKMFAAAMAGAPVVDMFSAYGGIRWQSGVNRSMQYEHGQSRIGGSPWEAPLQYVENSPLFWLPRIQTPLLIMSNDNDGAVPWYQGIELFVGMRRLHKPAWLLVYNGEEHNPTKRANQKDVAMRMQQFFDHYLKGAPEPEWMIKGIPYELKGRDQLQASSAVADPGK